ncbi:MAG: SDR family NAD(P)-dependent oxidoreductase [Bryobacteraceae bacterium]
MSAQPLQSKTAIVSGSSRGIGRAIALRLAARGAHAILCARDAEALASAVREIEAAGGRASSIAVDLREPTAAAKVAEFAIERTGRIDILVNNAGATKRGDFLELTEEDWADGFALKLFGAVRLIRVCWPHLVTTRGSVLNIAGTGGRTPGIAFSVGGSVNAAMLALTKSLAETGIRDSVQVNAINPGSVRTGRLSKRLADLAAKRGLGADQAEAAFIAAEKVTRIGEPEDIAALVEFVTGPGGRFLQGALIDMDGGATKTM